MCPKPFVSHFGILYYIQLGTRREGIYLFITQITALQWSEIPEQFVHCPLTFNGLEQNNMS